MSARRTAPAVSPPSPAVVPDAPVHRTGSSPTPPGRGGGARPGQGGGARPRGALTALVAAASAALRAAASRRAARRSRARALVADAYAEIRHADQKAAILLAASGVVLGAFLGAVLSGDWSPGALRTPWDRLFWGGCLAFGAATAAFASAVYPRLPTAQRRPVTTAVSFLDIERIGTDTELRSALDGDLSALLGHLRTVSRIVVRKYRLLRTGIALLVLSFTLIAGAAVGTAAA
ncbi:DUF5706 domain-containing protein [Nocardiopsis sp. RSe5-2]|uniref:DUF5706 domain-containing protein n=1 Tax=Nocardiopsis endophytica TaxID=3018445 RepID=A0ABT4U557_9ACTN|nr:Pycsar system effector family protein [Nocardiopsis endophytica]MDA2812088.1 DUF5706 domain-containing protein [Nocardiopsis endophytica]